MSAVIGALRAELSASIAQFQADMNKAAKSVQGFAKRATSVGKEMQSFGRGLSLGVTLPIVGLGVKALKASDDFELAKANVNAALKSMGNAAGFTQQQLVEMADALEKTSQFGDEDILNKVTANLLTFGTVAGDQFKRTQVLAVNLSTRLNQDLKDSTIQLGKALNDPIRGLTSLRRVGVQFTDSQEKMIKGLAKQGKLEEAQKIILTELEKEFGGAAEAMAKTDAGRQAVAMNQLSDSMREIGKTIRQVLPDFARAIKSIADAFESLSPAQREFAVKAGLAAAALGPLLIGAGGLARGIGAILPLIARFGVILGPVTSAISLFVTGLSAGLGVFETIGAVFAANPVGVILIALAAAAIAVFEAWKHWDQIKAFVSGVFDAVSNFLGPKIAPIFNALKPLIDAVMQSFRLFGKLIAQLFSGDIKGALSTYLQIWKTVFGAIGGIVGNAVGAIENWLRNKLAAVLDFVGEKVKKVTDFFKNMYDAVVGRSWVPDMVTAIGDWFAKLDDKMVTPAKRAAAGVSDAMSTLKDDVASKLQDMVANWDFSLSSIRSAIADLANDLFVNPVFDFLKGAIKGGVSSLTSGLGDFFGGFLADGGSVSPGKAFVVGERGPELFVPQTAGAIVPNGAFGMRPQIVFNVNARDADSFIKSEPQIAAMMSRALARGQRNL